MLKIATFAALLGVALAGTAEGKTKIINPWNNLGGNYKTCPDLQGRWPYCDIFLKHGVVIAEPGYGEGGYMSYGVPTEEGGYYSPKRGYFRPLPGSP